MNEKIQQCIAKCLACTDACMYCASSCLKETDIDMLRDCIRLDLECATLCRTAAEVMQLEGINMRAICELCASICTACAEECERHASHGMEHCRKCAQICRECADICLSMSAVA